MRAGLRMPWDLLYSWSPVSGLSIFIAVVSNLPLQKFLETKGQCLARNVYHFRYVCPGPIGSSTGNSRSYDLIICESLDLVVRAGAF
jgi:hypothetical protein